MSLHSYISNDLFIHVPASLSKSPSEDDFSKDAQNPIPSSSQARPPPPTTCVVFFITGNPGLIGYYRPFLMRLVGILEGEHGVGGGNDVGGEGDGGAGGSGSGRRGGKSDGDRKNAQQNGRRREAKGEMDRGDYGDGEMDAEGKGEREQDGGTRRSQQEQDETSIHQGQREEVVVFGASLGGFIDGQEGTFEESSGWRKEDGQDIGRDNLDDDDDDGINTRKAPGQTRRGPQRDTLDQGTLTHQTQPLDPSSLLFPNAISQSPTHTGVRVWSLREQVDLCISRLRELVRRVDVRRKSRLPSVSVNGGGGGSGGGGEPLGPVRVVLVGHSVGAWIALEMVRLIDQETESFNRLAFTIDAAVLLTPTIIELPLSQSGRLATPLLGSFLGGHVPALAQSAVWLMRGVVGERVLKEGVRRVTGIGAGRQNRTQTRNQKVVERINEGKDQDDDEEILRQKEEKRWEEEEKENGLTTTVRFLMSANGVRQAVGMAAEELRTIREDQWGGEVWGVVDEVTTGDEGGKTGGQQAPKLYFLFAGRDHWVADETRDKIIERSGLAKESGRPVLVVDEQLEHAWCLRQSGQVADRVGKWVKETIDH